MQYILVLLSFFSFLSFGQDFKIIVADSNTLENLPFVSIYFKASGVGAITNHDGEARFTNSKLLDSDSIVMKFIGYQTRVVPFSKDSLSGDLHLFLTTKMQNLEDVVITYSAPPPARKLVKNAIKNTNNNYSKEPTEITSLYRETVEEDGRFIQLNEAIVKTYYTGYPQKRLDRTIWMDWQYNDDYAFYLEGDRFFSPLLKDFNTKEDVQQIVASRHSDDWSEHHVKSTLVGDPLLLLAMDKIKYQYDFLNPKLLGKYAFQNKGLEVVEGETCYIISFQPKRGAKRFRIDQSKKNKSPIYTGRLWISKADFAVVSFEYQLAIDQDYGFFAKRIPLDFYVKVNYGLQDSLWSIQSVFFTESRKVEQNEKGSSVIHKANREFFVLHRNLESPNSIPDSLQFKSTSSSAIRYYPKNYNPSYWDDFQWSDSLTPKGKLLNDLSTIPLQEQFDQFIKGNTKPLPAPILKKAPYNHNYHGMSFSDSLHWASFPENASEFRKYLRLENEYCNNYLMDDLAYQEQLYKKLKGFYPKDKEKSAIPKLGLRTEEDSVGNILLYHQWDRSSRTFLLDLSAFRREHPGSYLKKMQLNATGSILLIQYEQAEVIGDFIVMYDVSKQKNIDSLDRCSDVEWYTDLSVIYARVDDKGRSEAIVHHRVGATDSVLYKEEHPEFEVGIRNSYGNFIVESTSKTENELYLVKASSGIKLIPIRKRESNVNLDAQIKNNRVYILKTDAEGDNAIEILKTNENFELQNQISPEKGDVFLEFGVWRNFIFACVLEKSIPKLKYCDLNDSRWKTVPFDYGIGNYSLSGNLNDTSEFQFSFSAPSQPPTTFTFDPELGAVLKKKQLKVDRAYHMYTDVKRLWVKGHDGVKIPLTYVKSRLTNGDLKGVILKVYGAYGGFMMPDFNARDALLLNQGYAIAYAHVRGGGVMGGNWYHEGRMLQKENSFHDYKSCAEYLIKKKIATPETLVAYGNSAGGLVVGHAANEYPELFHTIILNRAYLDVVNTMMNDTLPLTTTEYKEWGNPNQKENFDYIMDYSPYQNIKRQAYPNMIFIASYNDYQTPIWQIAKHVATIRENNTADTKIVLLTDMHGGHIGSTLGQDWIKEYAKVNSFVHHSFR